MSYVFSQRSKRAGKIAAVVVFALLFCLAAMCARADECENPFLTPEEKAEVEAYKERLLAEMGGEEAESPETAELFASKPTFEQYLADYNYEYNCYDFYKNRFRMPYRGYIEQRKDDAWYLGLVSAWRLATFSLTDIVSYSKKEIGFYESMIYDVLYEGQELESLSGTLKSVTKSVEASSWKKINDLVGLELGARVGTSTLTDDQRSLLFQAYTATGELKEVFKAIGNIDIALGYARDVEDLTERLAKAEVIMRKTKQTAKILTLMQQRTSDDAFACAIDNVLLACSQNSSEAAVLAILGGEVAALDAEEYFLKAVWKYVMTDLGSVGIAVQAGQAAGKMLSNLFFSTQEDIEMFYYNKALYEFEDCLKSAMSSIESTWKSSKTDENSQVFNEAYKMLLRTHLLGIKASKKIVEVEHDSGVINTIANFITGTNYDEYYTKLNGLSSSVNLTIEFMGEIAHNGYIDEYGDSYTASVGLVSIAAHYTPAAASQAIIDLDTLSYECADMNVTKVYTLQRDMHIFGNVTVGADLDLNGYTLVVEGSMTQNHGTVNVGSGNLKISGDYTLTAATHGKSFNAGSGRTEIGGNLTIESVENPVTNGKNVFHMENENAYVLVNGAMKSSGNSSSLTAGTLEVKGNFSANSTFEPSGTHKTILSGENEQTVTITSTPGCINILESTNPKVRFNNTATVNTIDSNSVFDTLMISGTTFSDGITVNVTNDFSCSGIVLNSASLHVGGNMTKTGIGTADLGSGRLEIEGNLTQNGGTVNVGSGSLKVTGNYTLTGDSGSKTFHAGSGRTEIGGDLSINKITSSASGTNNFHMENENAYVLVTGNFAKKSGSGSNLIAGTLEVKGNFTQGGATKSFLASGTHKTILSGEGEQVVTFSSTLSSFNDLYNRNPDGVTLSSNVRYVRYFVERPDFEVTFVTDCGTAISPLTVSYGGMMEKPSLSDPERKLSGWFRDEECTVPFDFSKPVRAAMTLYAKWINGDTEIGEVTRSGNTLRVCSYVSEEMKAQGGVLFTAAYDAEKMCACVLDYDPDTPVSELALHGEDPSEIRIFLLSADGTLMPLCGCAAKAME